MALAKRVARCYCFPECDGANGMLRGSRAPGDLEEAMRAAHLHSDTETTSACFAVLIFAQALKPSVRADQRQVSQL